MTSKLILWKRRLYEPPPLTSICLAVVESPARKNAAGFVASFCGAAPTHPIAALNSAGINKLTIIYCFNWMLESPIICWESGCLYGNSASTLALCKTSRKNAAMVTGYV